MTGLRVTPTAHRGEGLDEALRRGADVLRRAGIEQYRADAELLAAYLLDTDSQGIQGGSYGKTHVTRADVQRFALMGRRITPQDSVRYMELLERRAQRVPLQHITGVAPFYHLEIKVGPGVFIPRPETELLVEEALRVLATYESNARPRVVDLCTGSGAIAAAIKEENPQAEVFAVELSEQALLWARKNLDPQNVHLIPGDIRTSLEDLPGYFDLVLSNPPYIPPHRKPQAPEVAEYDPQMALYGGGEEGMEIPREVIARAHYLLRPGGFFMMEHDDSQEIRVAETLAAQGFVSIYSIQDLNGKPRHTAGYKPR